MDHDRRAGQLGTFRNKYLVACHAFDADWHVWGTHPKGDEIVFLPSRSAIFILGQRDRNQAIDLRESGACVIVPKGTWHTAKVCHPSRILFITAGEGTRYRDAAE